MPVKSIRVSRGGEILQERERMVYRVRKQGGGLMRCKDRKERGPGGLYINQERVCKLMKEGDKRE